MSDDSQKKKNRIISWLFSQKRHKAIDENQNQKELDSQKEKPKKIEKVNDLQREKDEPKVKIKGIENEDNPSILIKPIVNLEDEVNNDSILENESNEDKDSKNQIELKPPTTPLEDGINDELVSDIELDNKRELKEENKKKDYQETEIISIDEESINTLEDKNKIHKPNQELEQIDNQREPQIKDISFEGNIPSNNDILQIAVIEEIDKLLRKDNQELRDIQYKLNILMQQEEEAVLIEEVERLKKELEDLIQKFNEIKKKYEKAYNTISIKDINDVTNINIEFLIGDYINTSKNNEINGNILNQIHEIQEFINILDNVINIEKQSDDIKDKIDDKLDDFNIRDEEFIKIQDEFTNLEKINDEIKTYNDNIDNIIADLNKKIAASVDITKRIEITTSIVPDINRLIEATAILASSELIPSTPLGLLFKTTLFVSATHMIANAFIPKTKEREITQIRVTDYSKNILDSKSIINDVFYNIESAFNDIEYMKDIFDKQFSLYKSQIPEYDKFIENIFLIEKELSLQQKLAYDYNNKIDIALDENNKKIKLLEND